MGDQVQAQLDVRQASALKQCCANFYASQWATLLLGETFHPGAEALTARLGNLLDLAPGMRVLDVAAGTGASARLMAQRFGCHVVGIDYSRATVDAANDRALAEGLTGLVRFEVGDAEELPFADASFDAIICECAFCTFPDKPVAAAEFARVLRKNGRLGLSDLTRQGPLPAELAGLLAWIACIADAQSITRYQEILATAGIEITGIEEHDHALASMIADIRSRLLGIELLVKLKQLDFPPADIERAQRFARHAATAVQAGTLGYAVLVGEVETRH